MNWLVTLSMLGSMAMLVATSKEIGPSASLIMVLQGAVLYLLARERERKERA